MTTYLIKLRPLAPFFFGGERTFGEGSEANYFAKSNPFPQQTTILGMLRKELLIQNKIFKEKWNDYTDDDKNNMRELIGTGSFKLDGRYDLGRIKNMSPIFLNNGQDYFIPGPFDKDFKLQQNRGRAFLDKEVEHIPLADGYTPKKGLFHGFISKNTPEIKFSRLFHDFIKVGNTKEKEEDDKDKFFKQQFYTLASDYSFAFFAKIDFDLKSSTVYMGADNSSFRMDVEEANMSFEDIIPFKPSENKITLVSDALVDETIYALCQFAITKTVNFRTTDVRPGKFTKSKKYEMLKRGSVLVCESGKKQNIKNQLDNPNLQKIGYNIYR